MSDGLTLLCLVASAVAGAGLARLLRFPMWPMTGAIAGAAAVHLGLGLDVEVPTAMTVTAQVLVGTAVGAKVRIGQLLQARQLAWPGLLSVALIVVSGVVLGLGLAALHQVPTVDAVLGTIPGGGGEMVAAAESLDTDSSVVAAMHVVRVFIVLSLLPLLLRWAERHLAAGDGHEPA
jgi:membrane AbrB-like protein